MKNILIFPCFLLLSCSKPDQHKNEITKVELSRSGTWSDYGATIIIDSSLNFKYYDRNKKQGYIGKVDEKLFDTLNQKFESIKFKTMPIFGYHGCKDCKIFEFVIHWKNKKRRIIKEFPITPDSAFKVLLWLNDSYKRVKLSPVKTPFAFETTYAKEQLDFDIDSVKFPPPLPKPSKKSHDRVHKQQQE